MFVDDTKMITGRIPMRFFFLLIQFLFYALHSSTSPFLAIASSSETNLSHILQDVLKAISESENWNLKDVTVSKLDVGNVEFDTSQSYEFDIWLGKKQLVIKILDQFGSWRELRKPKYDLGYLIHQVTSLAVLDALEVEGPLELRVDALHHISLSSPMNMTYIGLRHILVGEGITLQIRRAHEVSFLHSSGLDLPNGRPMFSEWKSEFWPSLQSTCVQIIPIHISGTASLAAYDARNPGSYIEITFISEDTILLLPEKSYHGTRMHRKQSCPFDFLSMRFSMFEKTLRSLLGPRVLQNRMFVSLEAKTTASVAVKFPIGLERDVGRCMYRDSAKNKCINQRRIEMVWFEIVARVEADRLKPLSFQKMKFWPTLNVSMFFLELDHVFLPF